MKFEVLTSPECFRRYEAQIRNVIEFCIAKGKRVHCILEPEVQHRTDPQRNHLNGHIQQICQETGNEFEDVKQYIKRKAVKRGYPIKKHAGVDVMFRGCPVGISEADATPEECGYLIDEVHQLAFDLGINLKES